MVDLEMKRQDHRWKTEGRAARQRKQCTAKNQRPESAGVAHREEDTAPGTMARKVQKAGREIFNLAS